MIAKRVLIQSKPSPGKQQTKADLSTVLLRAFHTGMEVCVRGCGIEKNRAQAAGCERIGIHTVPTSFYIPGWQKWNEKRRSVAAMTECNEASSPLV